jgi:glutathione peroxidase
MREKDFAMRDRRGMLVLLAGAAVLPFCARPLAAQAPGMSRSTAYAFSFKALDGNTIRLAEFAGRPILIVNVASQCGHTPQYAGLRSLQERFGPRGLVILGVPSNDFDQEPGGASEILATAHGEYGVSFPLTEKSTLRGANAHPFYRWAATERPLDVPKWNFHKYLIGRDGHIAAVFPTRIEPTDARVIEAIVKELKAD